MKQIFFFIVLFTFLSLLLVPISFAATSLPSPSPSTSPAPSPSALPSPSADSEDTTQKLKDLIQQGTARVMGTSDQVGVQQRGFMGQIQRVTDNSVTVSTVKGSTEILNVTPDVILTRDNKKATIDDIAIGDYFVAIGTTDQDNFTLKKLQLSSTSLFPDTLITVLATVKTVGKTSLTASARNSTDVVTYILNKNTLYQDSNGNKVDPKTIKPDFQYLLVGTQDSSGITLTTVRTLGS